MIKEMTIADLKEVTELEAQCFPEDNWKAEDFQYELTSNPYAKFYLYSEEEVIKGYLGFWDLKDRLEITTLAVRNEDRKRGIAQSLLDRILEYGEVNKVKNITLEVRVNNQAAINLYRKNGFEVWALRKNYYEHEDGYLMGRGTK